MAKNHDLDTAELTFSNSPIPVNDQDNTHIVSNATILTAVVGTEYPYPNTINGVTESYTNVDDH
jgi:hypothetical protein